MNMTHHAATRAQQRCIPPLVIDLLYQFGAREPSANGTYKMFFDKASRRHVRAYVGQLARVVEEHLDVYAVISDEENVIITTAHRLKRIRRQ
jgi:hypothetical protein